MSYDLFFRPRHPGRPLMADDFWAFFQRSMHYSTTAEQALYENEDTGVYFSFAFHDEGERNGGNGGSPKPEVAFNINYFRPHIFALEAALELPTFIHHFDLLVDDPQGAMREEYSREGFLEGWNHGNQASYTLLTLENIQDVYTLPTEKIEAYWIWNYNRYDLQERYGSGIFVPRVLFFKHNGEAASLAVWTDAIPVALPVVDFVAILRTDPRVSRWPGKEKLDIALLAWKQLQPLLSTYEHLTEPVDYVLLDYIEIPREVLAFTRSQPRIKKKLNGIAVDHILNQELVDKAT